MSNALFPTPIGLGWAIGRTPNFSTILQEAASGFERRTALMSYPKYKFTLSYEFLRSDSANAELQNIQNFFLARQGALDNFLFDEPYTPDDAVTDFQFGTGDGSTVAFQLTRALKTGGFLEPVMNLNPASTVTNIKDNTAVVNPANYTVSSSGLITFSVAPTNGHTLTWTGAYYFRCRFKDDFADFENFMYQLWTLKKIELIGALGNKV